MTPAEFQALRLSKGLNRRQVAEPLAMDTYHVQAAESGKSKQALAKLLEYWIPRWNSTAPTYPTPQRVTHTTKESARTYSLPLSPPIAPNIYSLETPHQTTWPGAATGDFAIHYLEAEPLGSSRLAVVQNDTLLLRPRPPVPNCLALIGPPDFARLAILSSAPSDPCLGVVIAIRRPSLDGGPAIVIQFPDESPLTWPQA